MIKLPKDMSHDDVSQWLSGGYFLVRRKPTRDAEWVPCKWIGMDGGRVVGELLADGETVRVAHTSCAAVWPEMGSFNSPRGYAVHMARTVERQYRRTYHSRQIEVTVPWAYRAANSLRIEQNSMGAWVYIGALPFTGLFPASFDEAMDWLFSGKPTVAVNRRLIVAGDRRTDKRLLYLDGVLAASLVGGDLVPCCGPTQLRELNTLVGGRFNAI